MGAQFVFSAQLGFHPQPKRVNYTLYIPDNDKHFLT